MVRDIQAFEEERQAKKQSLAQITQQLQQQHRIDANGTDDVARLALARCGQYVQLCREDVNPSPELTTKIVESVVQVKVQY